MDEQWRMLSFDSPTSSRSDPLESAEYKRILDENKKLQKDLTDTKKSLAELVEELIFTESEVFIK